MDKEKNKGKKVVQISILAKVAGNVNADEVIGNRATLKKMYSSDGEVFPFVSARAVKFAIREALRNKGHEIDPYIMKGDQMMDSGDPTRYIDNDIFGYMCAPKKERGAKGEIAHRRQAPVALSYFKALRNTPIKSEFAARFPRVGSEGENPVPFEIEVAEFTGRLNCLIYDHIGRKSDEEKTEWSIDTKKRLERIRDFLSVFLTPTYVLPRRTNSLNIPEYYCSLVVLSDHGPLPVYQYLDYVIKDGNFQLDLEKLNMMFSRDEIKNVMGSYLVDYQQTVNKDVKGIKLSPLNSVIDEILKFLE